MLYLLNGGGLDSSAVLIWYASRGITVHSVHVDYGQKAAIPEFEAATWFARHYDMPISQISAKGLFSFSSADILDSHSRDIDMGPYAYRLELRNPILILLVASWVSSNIDAPRTAEIMTGFHIEHDHTYPDAHSHYLANLTSVLRQTNNTTEFQLTAPFENKERVDYIRDAYMENPHLFDKAYTCYEREPCLICPHCQQKKALMEQILPEQIR